MPQERVRNLIKNIGEVVQGVPWERERHHTEISLLPIIGKARKKVQSMPQAHVRQLSEAIPVPRDMEEIEEVVQSVNPCKIVQRRRSQMHPCSRLRRILLRWPRACHSAHTERKVDVPVRQKQEESVAVFVAPQEHPRVNCGADSDFRCATDPRATVRRREHAAHGGV